MGAVKRPVRTGTVTVLGQECTVRQLGLRGRRALQDAAKASDSSPEYGYAIVAAHGLYGTPTDEQIDDLYSEWDADFVMALAIEVMGFSGLGDDAAEDARKNS